jgi:hypothetical protein
VPNNEASKIGALTWNRCISWVNFGYLTRSLSVLVVLCAGLLADDRIVAVRDASELKVATTWQLAAAPAVTVPCAV